MARRRAPPTLDAHPVSAGLLALAVTLALLCGGCGDPAPIGSDGSRAASGPDAPQAPGSDAAELAPDGTRVEDARAAAGTTGTADPAGSSGPVASDRGDIAGTWWVLTPELPYLGLRLELRPTRVQDTLEGTCVAFDWRGTESGDALYRASRPVSVRATARVQGQQLALSVSGPTPMISAEGNPNGMSGRWQLRASVSLEAERSLQGTLIHSELTDADGLPCHVVSAFRRWAR